MDKLKPYKLFLESVSKKDLVLEYFYELEDEFNIDVKCRHVDFNFTVSFDILDIDTLEKVIPRLKETLEKVISFGEFKFYMRKWINRPNCFGYIQVFYSTLVVSDKMKSGYLSIPLSDLDDLNWSNVVKDQIESNISQLESDFKTKGFDLKIKVFKLVIDILESSHHTIENDK